MSKSMLSVAICVAMPLIAARAAAQTVVSPTLVPLPPGQMITVNNGPGDLGIPNDGTTFSDLLFEVTVLLDDVQRLIDSLAVSLTPPITGSVVDGNGVGVAVTPANQSFQWQGVAMSFSSFVLN